MRIPAPVLTRRLWDLALASTVVVATFVCGGLTGWAAASLTTNLVALSAIPLAGGSLAVTAGAIAASRRLSWSAIGLTRAGLVALPWGLASASAVCCLLVVVALAAGVGEYRPIEPEAIRFDWREWRLGGVALLAAGAFGEELFARGLALQFLARALGAPAAVAVTSMAFGLLHGGNPGVTALAQWNTALFGAAFALAVLWRRSLWLAVGLHLGWNLTQVGLGVNTSGITMRLTDLSLALEGPVWVTGGDYGFEGGLLATGALLGLVALLRYLPVGESDPMLWEREDCGPAHTGCAGGCGSGGDTSGRGKAGAVDSSAEG